MARPILRLTSIALLSCALSLFAQNAALSPAAQPLFRDPIHDGAADPVLVWNRARKTWWMFYTNRRADLQGGGGVEWVHGTHIGIARVGRRRRALEVCQRGRHLLRWPRLHLLGP